jgi:hypothetical protein
MSRHSTRRAKVLREFGFARARGSARHETDLRQPQGGADLERQRTHLEPVVSSALAPGSADSVTTAQLPTYLGYARPDPDERF